MRKIATITMLTLALAAVVFAQQKGTFKDARDGKTYKTVKIGTQTWMAENLNWAKDADGNDMGFCAGDEKHGDTHTLSDVEAQANCKKYGRLYSGKRFCPNGWHLPSDREWQILLDFAGKDAGKALKAKSGWSNFEGKSSNGTDKFGFAALPGGGFTDGVYEGIGRSSCWHSIEGDWGIGNSSERGENDLAKGCSGWAAYVRCVQGDAEAAAKLDAEAKAKAEAEAKAKAEAEAKAKAEALEAIRKANGGSTFTDARDKKIYSSVKIGGQTWMAQNLDYADKDSKCYDNKEENCKIYGRLYPWATALKICPAGWHLPSKAEWNALTASAGGGETAGKYLKATSGWKDSKAIGDDKEKSGNGEDKYGFSALPGGSQSGYLKNGIYNGIFENVGYFSFWWSSSENDSTYAYLHKISNGRDIGSASDLKIHLSSVRCVQGEAPKEASAPAQPAKPAAQPAPKQQQPANESCQITFPKKTCISMPAGTCKMSGGKIVDKCP